MSDSSPKSDGPLQGRLQTQFQQRPSAAPADSPSVAYIALGSNMGDREGHLRAAIAALQQLGDIGAISSFYQTEPVGAVAQSDFLNAVVELRTALQPEPLLTALLRTEREQGRDRSRVPPKGPRTLDLDLLSYDALILKTPALTLPHPAVAERGFVLTPLAEIAPAWRHPVSGKSAAALLSALQRKSSGHPPAVHRISKQP